MATQQTITAFDGAATPVQHILVPVGTGVLPDGTQYAKWREYNASLPSEACVRAMLTQIVRASGVTETRMVVETPVMEAVNAQNAQGYTAAPKVAFIEKDVHVKYSHPRSTGIVKNLNTQLLRNILNNVSVTTPAVSAGVVFEAVVQGVMPG